MRFPCQALNEIKDSLAKLEQQGDDCARCLASKKRELDKLQSDVERTTVQTRALQKTFQGMRIHQIK